MNSPSPLSLREAAQAAFDLLDRDATYRQEVVELTFGSHSEAVRAVNDVRQSLRLALSQEGDKTAPVAPPLKLSAQLLGEILVFGKLIPWESVYDAEGFDGGEMLGKLAFIAGLLNNGLATPLETAAPELTDKEILALAVEHEAIGDCNGGGILNFASALLELVVGHPTPTLRQQAEPAGDGSGSGAEPLPDPALVVPAPALVDQYSLAAAYSEEQMCEAYARIHTLIAACELVHRCGNGGARLSRAASDAVRKALGK